MSGMPTKTFRTSDVAEEYPGDKIGHTLNATMLVERSLMRTPLS